LQESWQIGQANGAGAVFSTFQIAESMGFKGEFRQWEELLRLGD
jgi:hypothetical protein